MEFKESKSERVDYDSINWEFGRKGSLFRGNSQSTFEKRALDTFLEGNPCYWGCSDLDGRKLTFCDPSMIISLPFMERAVDAFHESYGENFIPDINMPFSQSSINLEINAEPYRDRIYISTTGEGLIISGPIDLEHISVIFSTEDNKIEERNPVPRTNECLRNYINHIKRKGEGYGMSSDKSLLTRYDINPQGTLGLLWSHAYVWGHISQYKDPNPEDLEKLERYIELLKELF